MEILRNRIELSLNIKEDRSFMKLKKSISLRKKTEFNDERKEKWNFEYDEEQHRMMMKINELKAAENERRNE